MPLAWHFHVLYKLRGMQKLFQYNSSVTLTSASMRSNKRLKVLAHQAKGEFFLYTPNARRISLSSFFCPEGETKESTTSSSDGVLVMVGLKSKE